MCQRNMRLSCGNMVAHTAFMPAQKEAGISSAHYHAGMTPNARVKVQNAWRSGAVQVSSVCVNFGAAAARPL
jgi:superfamily II DNA helicase RecQ